MAGITTLTNNNELRRAGRWNSLLRERKVSATAWIKFVVVG
jgi:hypothetical protein